MKIIFLDIFFGADISENSGSFATKSLLNSEMETEFTENWGFIRNNGVFILGDSYFPQWDVFVSNPSMVLK